MSSPADARQIPGPAGARHGDLPAELRQIAEQELGETESRRQEALEKLTHLLQDEADLHARTDPEFLLRFIRVRKYDVDAALITIRKYYKSRAAFATTFRGLTPASVNPDAKNFYILMPERDRHGRLIMLMRIGAWDPNLLSYHDLQHAGMMCLDHTAADPSTQTAGITLIIDFEGYTATKLLSCSIDLIRRGLNYIQNCLPIRLKAQHIVRESYVFDLLYALIRPFITKKMTTRIHCHGHSFEKLHDEIDPSVLPEEYGGHGPPLDYDTFWKQLEEQEPVFIDNNRYGYHVPPSDSAVDDDYKEENTDL